MWVATSNLMWILITQPQCSGWVIRSSRHLSTFRGPGDLFSLCPDQLEADLFEVCGHSSPPSPSLAFLCAACIEGVWHEGSNCWSALIRWIWIRKGATYIETQINVIVKNSIQLIKKNITLSRRKKPTWAIFVPTMLKHIILLALPIQYCSSFFQEWAKITKLRCDLSRHCHKANLFVKPRKGKAIMWYNHLRDAKTGWYGRLDEMSYHGGCDIIKGEKWIANNWINILGKSRETMVSYKNPKKRIK